jgi:hypothetical protein
LNVSSLFPRFRTPAFRSATVCAAPVAATLPFQATGVPPDTQLFSLLHPALRTLNSPFAQTGRNRTKPFLRAFSHPLNRPKPVQTAPIRFLFLGGTGYQPVASGNLPDVSGSRSALRTPHSDGPSAFLHLGIDCRDLNVGCFPFVFICVH